MNEDEMLGLFVQESRDHLAALEADLLALESDAGDAARLNRVFRAVHTVKGTAGFFGFAAITALAHVMESVLALVRDGRMAATPALVTDLLAATDRLRAMVADPRQAATVPSAAELAALQALLHLEPALAAGPAARSVPTSLHAFRFDPELIRAALREGHHFYVVQLRLQADIEAAGQTPLHYLREIATVGTLIDTALDLGSVGGLEDDTPSDLVCSVLFATPMEPDLLLGAFGIPATQLAQTSSEFFQDWLKSQPTLVPRAPTASDAAPHPRLEESVRLPVRLLDELTQLVGELVRGRDQLVRLAGESGAPADLAGAVRNVATLATDLEQALSCARCQPVGTLFGRFPRLVHDLGRKLGKEMRLETSGDDLPLDRALLAGLTDPLTHLIRNSADHGIEPPAERRRLGKPDAGVVRLCATQADGAALVEIRDDGRGLDLARIAAKAVERQLLTAAQAGALAPAEIRRLIFAPGLSTAAEVSDVSGRGVGMDVVKTDIENLGGQVEVDSEPGQGTVVTIRLPLRQPRPQLEPARAA